MRKGILLCIFFLCGAAVSACGWIWIEKLTLLIGNTHYAASIASAVFLICLSLGALVASKWGRDRATLLRRLLGIELFLTLFCVAFPWLVPLAGWLYPTLASFAPAEIARVVASGICLSIPAFSMGAVFPMAMGLYMKKSRVYGSQAGGVTCLALAGAASGVALAGFGLLPVLGFQMACCSLALLHAGLCLLVVVLKPIDTRVATSDEESLLDEIPQDLVDYMGEIRSSVLFAAIFCTAFSSIILYLLWHRILAFFLGESAFAHVAVTVVYFAAFGAGAGLMGIITRFARPSLVLGSIILFLGGAFTCLGLQVIPLLHDRVSGSLDMGLPFSAGEAMGSALIAGGLLFVPSALLIPMILPLTTGFQLRMRGAACRISGLIVAALFFGACMGMLATSRFILSALTLKLGVMIAGFMVLAAGLLMLIFAEARGWKKGALFISNLVLIYLLAWFMTDQGRLSRPHLILDSAVFSRSKFDNHYILEAYREGPGSTVSVVRDIGSRDYLQYINALKTASTGTESLCRRMCALLPVMACHEPKEILVLGYGTGIVPGSLLPISSIRKIEVVEPSEAIFDVAQHFSIINRRAGIDKQENPGIEVKAGLDGRDHLSRGDKRYDVITIDPMLPWLPQSVHGYTTEFYDLCLDRLNDGGVICQAIPFQGMPLASTARLLNSFVRSVPGTAVILVDQLIVMLGFKTRAWKLDLDRIESLMNMPAVKGDLASMDIFLPMALAGAYLGDGEALLQALDEQGMTEVMSDDHPVLKYRCIDAPEGGVDPTAEIMAFLLTLDASFADRLDMHRYPADRKDEIISRARAFHLSSKLFMRGCEQEARLKLAAASGETMRGVREGSNYFERSFYLNPENRRAARKYAQELIRNGLLEIESSRFALAHELASKAAAIAPELYEVYMAKGFLHLAAGNQNMLEQVVEIMRQMRPFSTMTFAFDEKLSGLKNDEEQRKNLALLLSKSGGLSEEEATWFAMADAASRAGKARYAVPSIELALDLLMRGPDALTETGRRAWDVVSSFDEALLERAMDELLLKSEDDNALNASVVRALGFFSEENVMERLRELFREKSGSLRELALESLTRTGDARELINVLEDENQPLELRQKAAQIAGELNLTEALKPLIDLLESPEPSLRLGGYVALLNLTHVHFNYDPHAELEDRQRAVEQWRQWYRIRSGIDEP